MAAQVQVVEVTSVAEIDTAISAWIVQGYTVANRTPTSATLIKPKQFSVLWAVIGFLVCVLPLLIYLIVYAAESDKVVEIRVRSAAPQQAAAQELARIQGLLNSGQITEIEADEARSRLAGPDNQFCSNCGALTARTSTFCESCGAQTQPVM
jgi:hypothetical protein